MGKRKPGEARTVKAAVRRGAIVGYLEAHPGSSLRGLCQGLRLAAGTVRHHVGILERHDQVWHERIGCKDWYFAGTRPDRRRAVQEAMVSGLRPGLQLALRVVRQCGPIVNFPRRTGNSLRRGP